MRIGIVLLLTTTGRKSGLLRVTLLQFEEIDGDYYIASARGSKADWFKNIRANPKVHVQIREREFDAAAELIADVPKPFPRANEVLIRVRAAAVTSSDCIVRSGGAKPLLWLPMRIFVGFTRPRNPVLGLDLAGEVEAVGSAVRCFQVDAPVIAFTGKHFGAYAEYACLPADGVRGPQDALIALKPAIAPLPSSFS